MSEKPKYKPWMPNVAFGFLLSGFMSLIISGVSTARAIGFEAMLDSPSSFLTTWMSAYFPSWAVAFPAVLFVAPMVRKIVASWFPPATPNR